MAAMVRDLPEAEEDLPEMDRDLRGRDLPGRDLPDRDPPGADQDPQAVVREPALQTDREECLPSREQPRREERLSSLV